jgi:dihydroneopterin aldolase
LTPSHVWLFLDRYKRPISIGVLAPERQRTQMVAFSIDFVIPAPVAGDAIEATTDYDLMRAGVDHIVKDRHFDLQETLCARLLDFCRSTKNVRGAIVRTEKLEAYPDVIAAGCEMSWFDEGVLLKA